MYISNFGTVKRCGGVARVSDEGGGGVEGGGIGKGEGRWRRGEE